MIGLHYYFMRLINLKTKLENVSIIFDFVIYTRFAA